MNDLITEIMYVKRLILLILMVYAKNVSSSELLQYSEGM